MNKKIKVMHFVSGFKNGGVEQVILNYTRLLNKNCDIKESIVYQHKANPQKLFLSRIYGNKMYRIPYKKEHPIKNLIATYRLIKKEKPDIIHAHMSLVNFFPLMVAKLLDVPVRISHSHIARDSINSKLVPLFKKLNIIFATNLMACGKNAGKYMYGNNKFTILPNAIDQSKYGFHLKWRKQIRKNYNISKNTVLLGTIGRNVKQKNQDFLIDILAAYLKINNNAILMIIGDGPLSKHLQRYIKIKGCSQNVIRIKSSLTTQKYYSAFDVFLLPSLYEGLPVVAIESQASGLLTLLSENIDHSVKYSKFTYFLPVDQGVSPWIKKINSIKFKRNIKFKRIYDINYQYDFLYDYYINNLKREKK